MGRILAFIGLAIAALCVAPIILFSFVNDDPTANPMGYGLLAWLGTPIGLILAGIGAAVALLGGEARRPPARRPG